MGELSGQVKNIRIRTRMRELEPGRALAQRIASQVTHTLTRTISRRMMRQEPGDW